MMRQIARTLQSINPWHFVWIGIISSEILTTLLSTVISLTLWGSISNQILLVGFIDAFVVSLIVVFITVYFLKRTARLAELNESLQIEISNRKKVEEALSMSEKLFRQLAENIDEVFWVASLDFKEMIYISPAYEEIWGRSRESLYRNPKDWLDAIHPEDRERAAHAVNNARGEQNFAVEYRITRADNSIRWIYNRGFVVRNDEGQVYRMTGIAEDITERKSLEEQLRQSQKLEAVGILAGGIAHEFNNILATVNGSTYIIQKKLPEDSPVMKYTEQLAASINKANSLSQGLLAFSRKQTITLRLMDLNEIIRRATELLSPFIGEHIELTMILTEENPTVMADINQIEQVLVNLATNAVDAMPDRGRLVIQTDLMEMDEEFKKEHGYGASGRYALLTVSDTGTGIEEEIRDKIFEPFFTTKAVGKGSGLGLAVTYGIVKQHNGFIDVESVPRKGTTFKIFIPAVEAEARQSGSRDILPAIGGEETILLAEDDADARTIMSEILGMNGYKVLEARDGEDAIRLYTENRDKIHLVLLDVRMPKKNGREVYEEIRKAAPGSKFLFMSGYTADIIGSHGISEEGFDFISKTALPDEVLRKMREVLDK